MRRHLLLLIAALAFFVPGAFVPAATAATVYKCTDAKGNIAYQNTYCATHEQSRVMQFVPDPPRSAAPAAAESPAGKSSARAKPSAGRRKAATKSSRTRGKRTAPAAWPAEDMSWECRIGNGEVFYQHAPCPGGAYASHSESDKPTRGRRQGAARLTPISSKPIPRAEACRRIHAPSASSRPGHERDKDVSTYERNLGRDPCR